jgi:sugar/nucleoside kinase (ribokinase family)
MLDVFLKHFASKASFVTGGTSYLESARICLGGAGNVAEGLSLLGGKVCFIGKAGNDSWGRIYEANLNASSITTKIFFEPRISTGIALVGLHKKGERSFNVFRGANDRLSSKEIDRSAKLLGKSEYLYFCGYSLVANPQRDAILHALTLAKKNGVKVFFDPGAYNLIDSDFRLFNELFHSCDVFCPNLDEAKAILKTHWLERVIRELRKTGKFTALKCGARGCILINETECIKVPGFEANCVDTTGAGDAFAAALIYGLINHFPLICIGQLASWFAAQVTKGIGARSFPDKSRVCAFLTQVKNRRTMRALDSERKSCCRKNPLKP